MKQGKTYWVAIVQESTQIYVDKYMSRMLLCSVRRGHGDGIHKGLRYNKD